MSADVKWGVFYSISHDPDVTAKDMYNEMTEPTPGHDASMKDTSKCNGCIGRASKV